MFRFNEKSVLDESSSSFDWALSQNKIVAAVPPDLKQLSASDRPAIPSVVSADALPKAQFQTMVVTIINLMNEISGAKWTPVTEPVEPQYRGVWASASTESDIVQSRVDASSGHLEFLDADGSVRLRLITIMPGQLINAEGKLEALSQSWVIHYFTGPDGSKWSVKGTVSNAALNPGYTGWVTVDNVSVLNMATNTLYIARELLPDPKSPHKHILVMPSGEQRVFRYLSHGVLQNMSSHLGAFHKYWRPAAGGTWQRRLSWGVNGEFSVLEKPGNKVLYLSRGIVGYFGDATVDWETAEFPTPHGRGVQIVRIGDVLSTDGQPVTTWVCLHADWDNGVPKDGSAARFVITTASPEQQESKLFEYIASLVQVQIDSQFAQAPQSDTKVTRVNEVWKDGNLVSQQGVGDANPVGPHYDCEDGESRGYSVSLRAQEGREVALRFVDATKPWELTVEIKDPRETFCMHFSCEDNFFEKEVTTHNGSPRNYPHSVVSNADTLDMQVPSEDGEGGLDVLRMYRCGWFAMGPVSQHGAVPLGMYHPGHAFWRVGKTPISRIESALSRFMNYGKASPTDPFSARPEEVTAEWVASLDVLAQVLGIKDLRHIAKKPNPSIELLRRMKTWYTLILRKIPLTKAHVDRCIQESETQRRALIIEKRSVPKAQALYHEELKIAIDQYAIFISWLREDIQQNKAVGAAADARTEPHIFSPEKYHKFKAMGVVDALKAKNSKHPALKVLYKVFSWYDPIYAKKPRVPSQAKYEAQITANTDAMRALQGTIDAGRVDGDSCQESVAALTWYQVWTTHLEQSKGDAPTEEATVERASKNKKKGKKKKKR